MLDFIIDLDPAYMVIDNDKARYRRIGNYGSSKLCNTLGDGSRQNLGHTPAKGANAHTVESLQGVYEWAKKDIRAVPFGGNEKEPGCEGNKQPLHGFFA